MSDARSRPGPAEYGLHPLNVNADVLDMAKYVKGNKITLMYVEHGSSNEDSSIFPTSSVEGPIVDETVDPFDGLDEILERVGHMGNFKEVEVDADNETEEESDTEENDISDPKHDISIAVVEVHEHDLDVIDYDSSGSDLDDGIDSERRIQLRELRRIGKEKNQGSNKYYFYLSQQFATKEIMKGRVKKHSVETRRKLILVKNDKERVRVRCEWTIPALVPFVVSDTAMDKNVFSQTKGGPIIRENNINGKQNLGHKKAVGVKVVQVKQVVIVNRVEEQDKLLLQGMSLVKLMVLVNRVNHKDKLLVQGMPQVKLLVLVNLVPHQTKQTKDQVNIVRDQLKHVRDLGKVFRHQDQLQVLDHKD
ncbi:mutator type transposase [Tanacetum coccineum]